MNSFAKGIPYFQRGFSLAFKSIKIYLIYLLLSFFGFLAVARVFSFDPTIISLITIILSFVTFGYALSIPLFFEAILDNRKLAYADILHETLRGMKRSILPLLLLFVIGIILTFITVLSVIFVAGGKLDFFELTSGLTTQGFSLTKLVMSVVSGFVYSVLVYTAMYFSLRKKGLIPSTINSVVFSFKHLSLTLMFLTVYSVFWLFSSVLSIELDIFNIMYSSVYLFVTFVLEATAFLYFSSIEKKSISP